MERVSYALVYECANLCEWIYQPSNQEITKPTMLEIDRYENIHIDKDNHNAILRSYTTDNSDTIFIIFCGTKDLKGVITDIGAHLRMVQDKNENIISHLHSGMYSSMHNHFWTIHNCIQGYIQCNAKTIRNIVVTGHSLGGGIASLYGFETMWQEFTQNNNDKELDLYHNYNTKIITFGSPLIFAIKKDVKYHQYRQKIFQKLHNISHHFINNCDAVPRLLGSQSLSWFTLSLNALKITGLRNLPQKFYMNWLPLLPGFKGAVDKSIEWTISQMTNSNEFTQILDSFYGVGLYYAMKEQNELFVNYYNDKFIYKHKHANNGKDMTQDDAKKFVENHMIKSYINTLESNGIVNAIRSEYNTCCQKTLRIRHNEMIKKQKELEKSVKIVHESLDDIKDQLAKSNNQITSLKQNWIEKESTLLNRIKKEVALITKELESHEKFVKQNKNEITKCGNTIRELSSLYSDLSDNKHQIELNRNNINDLSETWSNKVVSLNKRIGDESSALKKDINRNKNDLFSIKAEQNQNKKELNKFKLELKKNTKNNQKLIQTGLDNIKEKVKYDQKQIEKHVMQKIKNKLDDEMKKMNKIIAQLRTSQNKLQLIVGTIVSGAIGYYILSKL